MDDRETLADAIASDRDLYDVVVRHGLTEDDLLRALRTLRQDGSYRDDLWTLVSYAARETQRAASRPERSSVSEQAANG